MGEMLNFKDLYITVGNRNLVQVNSLELKEGMFALVGRNGAGKSTFFNAIIGQHSSFSGEIQLLGKNVLDYSARERAKAIAIVYTKSTLFGNHSGREVLLLGRLPYQNAFAKTTHKDHQKINEIIAELEIESFVDREFARLSDGQKQLIMIGRALAQETRIILLDEPGAFLDLVNRHKLMQVLLKIGKKMDKLVIFSTHEIGFLPKVCSGVLLIEDENMRLLENSDHFIAEISASFGIDKLGMNEV